MWWTGVEIDQPGVRCTGHSWEIKGIEVPKKDGSLTKIEQQRGYSIKHCIVGKRSHLWFWYCGKCGEGAGLATQGLADKVAREHRCK
jgi:hypothetical protein